MPLIDKLAQKLRDSRMHQCRDCGYLYLALEPDYYDNPPVSWRSSKKDVHELTHTSRHSSSLVQLADALDCYVDGDFVREAAQDSAPAAYDAALKKRSCPYFTPYRPRRGPEDHLQIAEQDASESKDFHRKLALAGVSAFIGAVFASLVAIITSL